MRTAIGVLIIGLAGMALAQDEERVTVVFVDRTINVGAEAAPAIDLYIACAPNTPGQAVTSCTMVPRPEEIETNPWGQRIARWSVPNLAPGEHLVARSITEATLRPWSAPLAEALGEETIPIWVDDLYLADGAKYALDSETIREAMAEIDAGGSDPVETIGAIFDYITEKLSYSRDGSWDSADEVLERGTGSCSEYTFCFIALCRAHGIPARFAGGNARRSGANVHIDRVSHRWAEAYVRGVGWAPFDPTRSDGKTRYRRYFGKAPMNVLTLVQGDGGEESPLDWRYESYHRWEGDDARLKIHRRGWWLPTPSREVRKQVMALARKIPRAGDTDARLAIIDKAREIADPFVLPWLDDLLYQPDVATEAAKAMRDIGGPATVVAVIDCIGRTGDLQHDERIAAFLNDWTGESLSAARTDWDGWLRTKAFSAFTKPGRLAEEK